MQSSTGCQGSASERIPRHELSDLATRAMARIQQDGPMWQEHVIGWELVPADHYTESEFNQLQYEWHIEYWAALIELPD